MKAILHVAVCILILAAAATDARADNTITALATGYVAHQWTDDFRGTAEANVELDWELLNADFTTDKILVVRFAAPAGQAIHVLPMGSLGGVGVSMRLVSSGSIIGSSIQTWGEISFEMYLGPEPTTTEFSAVMRYYPTSEEFICWGNATIPTDTEVAFTAIECRFTMPDECTTIYTDQVIDYNYLRFSTETPSDPGIWVTVADQAIQNDVQAWGAVKRLFR